ncbi:MAG: DNA gyrase C-terminal beta-propeller domain-containing protein, partial [Planctomycetota bacterium]
MLQASREASGLALSRLQAEAIGALRLIQLVGLEIEKLVADYAELLSKIRDYEAILADDVLVRNIIREDCTDLLEKFDTPRLTTFEEAEEGDFDMGAFVKEHTVAVSLSHRGFAKRLPIDTFRVQGRGGTGVKGGKVQGEDDFIAQLLVCGSHDDLMFFTDTGRVFVKKAYEVPEASRTSAGRSVRQLLELKENESIVSMLALEDFRGSEQAPSGDLFFATRSGRVKRSALSEFKNINRSGLIALNLNDGDALIGVVRTEPDDHVLLATEGGMAIRFQASDARSMGRSAAGVKGMDLGKGDAIIGLIRVNSKADLLSVTENGYGKRTPLHEYLVQKEDGSAHPQNRGGKGRRDIVADQRNG